MNIILFLKHKISSANISYLLQPGAGTISPEIISSLIIGGSDGGGGQTSDSMISSVDLMIPEPRSGGSTREDLQI